MKKLTLLLIVSLVASCSYMKNSRRHHGEHGINLFKKMDKNGDNIITKKEMIEAHKKSFKEIDKNGDCKISNAEAKAAGLEEKFLTHLKKHSKKKHADCKDTLAAEEKRFNSADSNHDGKVTWEEYKKHYSSSMK